MSLSHTVAVLLSIRFRYYHFGGFVLRKNRLRALFGALLSAAFIAGALSGPSASAAEFSEEAYETFASIDCGYLDGNPVIRYKGWGMGYAPGAKVDVYLDVTGPSALVVAAGYNDKTSLYTDGGGNWSTSTYTRGGGSGYWTLRVRAYRPAGGMLNEAHDNVTC